MPSEKETNPYTAPQSDLGAVVPCRPGATKLAKTGAWMQLLPLLGIIGTTFGMVRAFATLKTTGAGDPAKLSAAIGEVLIATAVGFWGGMIGCILLGLAVFAQRNQPRWVEVIFWLAVLPAIIGVLMFVSAIAGIIRGAA